jgi:hypothetical protein
MEMIVLDTLGKFHRHGHGPFGWCCNCGNPSRYWADVKARRTPQLAQFDIDLPALIRERAENSPVVRMEPASCPRCGSRKVEMRVTTPSKLQADRK